jgi:hypothetical protein
VDRVSLIKKRVRPAGRARDVGDRNSKVERKITNFLLTPYAVGDLVVVGVEAFFRIKTHSDVYVNYDLVWWSRADNGPSLTKQSGP